VQADSEDRAIDERYHSPVKRSVTIAGHPTSITLEPVFWLGLEQAALRRDLPLSALVARIDSERIMASHQPNLASAIRCWLYSRRLDENESHPNDV